ncbi:MAG: hypothetical protein JWO70_2349 [Betaproteobacteria bacterium]|nr:hypothetical protein [Betaproteobacteria bacterium]
MKGILFSQMEPPPDIEADFNDWYETEHIPARLALPGFSAAVRYAEREKARRYLAIYEIDDLAVLESPAYQVLKTRPSERTAFMLKNVKGFTRYTCTQAFDSGAASERGKYLSAVAFAVPRGAEAQLDDWYESEHIPALMRAPDWLRVRRYKVFSADGAPWTDIALHELRSLDVMDGPERKAARTGPKRDALAGEQWFENSGRWVYEVLSVASSS